MREKSKELGADNCGRKSIDMKLMMSGTAQMVNDAAWFAAFSVALIAVALVIAIIVGFVRRKAYTQAVEGRHEGEHFVGARKNRMPVTHHMVTPFQIILIGFFVSSVVMFMPYCYYANSFGMDNWGKAFMAALHGTLRMFVLDGEYDAVAEFTTALVETNARVGWFYIVWSWVLYVLAPVLATGIILTLFRNALSYLWYRAMPFVKNIYVMSELNEKSLALAEDIVIRDRSNRSRIKRMFLRTVVVFTDVFEKNEEENYELVAKAKSLGAICVKRDITELSLRGGRSFFFRIDRMRKIYMISENEDENVDQGLKIIDLCRKSRGYNNRNTEIYIFSCSAESATLIDTAIADDKSAAAPEPAPQPATTENSAADGKARKKKVKLDPRVCYMKVRRVDDNYNLILKFLWENSIFDYATDKPTQPQPETATAPRKKTRAATSDAVPAAVPAPLAEQAKDDIKLPAPIKELHVLIVGLGGYGMDILRTLCWCTQMPGYKFVAEVFDGENGEDKFRHVAPELYAKRADTTDGEPYYEIHFTNNVKVGEKAFDDGIRSLKNISLAFCTLGDDEENIACSMELRKLLGKTVINGESVAPKIYTVVYAPQLNRRLIDRKNNDYDIDFIGGIYERFTLDVIEQSELEVFGRVINLEYAINSTVWDFISGQESLSNPVFRDLSNAVSNVDEYILKLFQNKNDDCELPPRALAEEIDKMQNEYLEKVNSPELSVTTKAEIESANSYDKFEYNRRSSIARALHVRWLVALFCNNATFTTPYNDAIKSIVSAPENSGMLYNEIDKVLAKNEHNRWSAYTRSIGYVKGERDDIRKTHNMLKPFAELPDGNKLKDRPIGALSRYLTLKIAESVKPTEDR